MEASIQKVVNTTEVISETDGLVWEGKVGRDILMEGFHHGSDGGGESRGGSGGTLVGRQGTRRREGGTEKRVVHPRQAENFLAVGKGIRAALITGGGQRSSDARAPIAGTALSSKASVDNQGVINIRTTSQPLCKVGLDFQVGAQGLEQGVGDGGGGDEEMNQRSRQRARCVWSQKKQDAWKRHYCMP
ncbi:unnamed protein product [Choristocarpus tenellus]